MEKLSYEQIIARTALYRPQIRTFVKDMWGLEPQPPKPQYKEAFETICRKTGDDWEEAKKTVKADWFGDPVNTGRRDLEWKWFNFEKGKHYSWQQNLILIGVEKAIQGDASRLISVVSGHGIGKSATCAWIIIWFLYCFQESQVPVTAPTSHQMHDVLWKELSIWIKKISVEKVRELYDWTSDYVRIIYSPESWFARARTSTKENTEAIAGVHADHVCIVVDEASGVPQQVFDTAEGALTSGNVFVFLISNGTQTMGYFYDTHHIASKDWQNYAFDGEESPLVDRSFIALKAKHGFESDEYKIRVKGKFPGESQMDDSGYLQLIPEGKIIVRPVSAELPFIGRKILGIDPSGEGKDSATYVIRDRFKAQKVFERHITNDREIAEDALTLIDRYKIAPRDVVVGAFGAGGDVGKEMAIATANNKNGPFEIYTVFEGNTPQKEEEYNYHFFERKPDEITNPEGRPDKFIDIFMNLRALMYFRAARWLIKGGQLVDFSVDNSPFVRELLMIRYKRSLQGNKIQLMSKKEMSKLKIPSPNIADAFALTFLRDLEQTGPTARERELLEEAQNEILNEDDRFRSI